MKAEHIDVVSSAFRYVNSNMKIGFPHKFSAVKFCSISHIEIIIEWDSYLL